jgi:hypothetical protein
VIVTIGFEVDFLQLCSKKTHQMNTTCKNYSRLILHK